MPWERELPRRGRRMRVLALTSACLVMALVACGGGGTGADTASTEPTTVAPTTTTIASTTTPITTTTGRLGVFVPAAGQGAKAGSGRLTTYSVEVEEATGLDPNEVAVIVERIFADPRSWPADATTSLQRVESGGSLQILVATPATVDQRCRPLDTRGKFSCHQGPRLNINADRWLNGTPDYPLPLAEYRANVINHEMGHALGHGHLGCPGPGQPAPVMMQQTKGLQGCKANSWPFPEASPPPPPPTPRRSRPDAETSGAGGVVRRPT